MKILDSSGKLVLVSDKKQTMILKLPKLTLWGTPMNNTFSLGCLQYETGITAIGKESIVYIHDFKFNRKIKQIQTYLKLIKIYILKNIMIAASKERILVYDIVQDINLCHIATSDGSSCVIYNNYFHLKLLYPISENIFEQQEVHTAKVSKIQLLHIDRPPLYDYSGQIICVIDSTILSLYQQEEIIRGCSFNSPIQDVIVGHSDRTFFIKTKGGGKNNEPMWLKVTDEGKKYLKIQKEKDVYEVPYNGLESGNIIVNNDKLWIWKENKLYPTQIDHEPQFMEKQKQQIKQNEGEQQQIKNND